MAGEQLVEWKAGYLWRYETFVDDVTGLIVGAENYTQKPLSDVLVMIVARVYSVAIN